MDDSRITKKVFNYGYNKCDNNWSSDVKEIFTTLGISDQFQRKLCVDLNTAKIVNYSTLCS